MDTGKVQDLVYKSRVCGNLVKGSQGPMPFLRGGQVKTFAIPLTEHTRLIECNVREKGLQEILSRELLWHDAWVATQTLVIPGAIKLAVNRLAQKIFDLDFRDRQPEECEVLSWYLNQREMCSR